MENYLVHTRHSFDQIADSFDEEDMSNEILQWMRNVMYEIYLDNFKSNDRVLELNAGTGIDAVFLASKGIKTYATDLSGHMIAKLNEKIINKKLEGFITTDKISFNEIADISESNFDGVISNFGGLNCINKFTELSSDLADKIKPSGKFIAAVMNSFCPWEIFYFLSKLDFTNAFRRFNKNGIQANLSQFKIRSFYFSPKEFADQFKNFFELEKVFNLGLLTPPPYLHGLCNRAGRTVKLLMKADNHLKGVYPFNRFGDHFVVVLRRKEF